MQVKVKRVDYGSGLVFFKCKACGNEYTVMRGDRPDREV